MNEKSYQFADVAKFLLLGIGIGLLVGCVSVFGYYRLKSRSTRDLQQELARRELDLERREQRISESSQRIDEILRRDGQAITDTREAVKALADCLGVLRSMYSSGDDNTDNTTEEVTQ